MKCFNVPVGPSLYFNGMLPEIFKRKNAPIIKYRVLYGNKPMFASLYKLYRPADDERARGLR